MKSLMGFEPTHQNAASTKGMYKTLSLLAGNSPADVAYVVTRTESYLNLAFDVPAEERFSDYPLRLMKASLKKAGVKVPDTKIHLLDFETVSTTKAVDHFLKFGEAKKFDFIGLFTHGKAGFERFVVGSFAETAIHRSKTHILTASPKTKFSDKIKNVLYLSDFDKKSEKAFSEVVDLCKNLGAHLTVFHAAEVIYDWSFDENSPRVKAYRRSVQDMMNWMISVANRKKVEISVLVSTQLDSVSELALSAARKSKADLVVTVAKSGPMTALMGGSTTRQIVRSSPKPVLVLKT